MPLTKYRRPVCWSAFQNRCWSSSPSGALVFANAAARALLDSGEAIDDQNIADYLPENERSRLDPLAWLQRWADNAGCAGDRLRPPACAHRVADGNCPVRVRVGRFREHDQTLYVVMLQDISLGPSPTARDPSSAPTGCARTGHFRGRHQSPSTRLSTITYANPSAEALFGYGSR